MSLLSCSRAFTITQATTAGADMGLDQAIYNSTSGKIYGIRGPLIHVYNGTTGALENTYWMLASCLGISSICTIGTTLYFSSFNPQIKDNKNPWAGQSNTSSDIWRIDTTGLAGAPTCCEIFTQIASLVGASTFIDGIGPLAQNGATVASMWHNRQDTGLAVFNGAGAPPFSVTTDPLDSVLFVNGDLCFDSSTVNLISSVPPSYRLMVHDITALPGSIYDTYVPYYASALPPIGVCWCASTNRIYVATGTATVVKHPLDLSTNTNIATGVAGATPIRIKYSAASDKIYVPNWAVNSVTVIDPATDACTVKTGFDHPRDIVVAGAKVFAVQDGTPTLKEVV